MDVYGYFLYGSISASVHENSFLRLLNLMVSSCYLVLWYCGLMGLFCWLEDLGELEEVTGS